MLSSLSVSLHSNRRVTKTLPIRPNTSFLPFIPLCIDGVLSPASNVIYTYLLIRQLLIIKHLLSYHLMKFCFCFVNQISNR